jgi:hypothetical protein
MSDLSAIDPTIIDIYLGISILPADHRKFLHRFDKKWSVHICTDHSTGQGQPFARISIKCWDDRLQAGYQNIYNVLRFIETRNNLQRFAIHFCDRYHNPIYLRLPEMPALRKLVLANIMVEHMPVFPNLQYMYIYIDDQFIFTDMKMFSIENQPKLTVMICENVPNIEKIHNVPSLRVTDIRDCTELTTIAFSWPNYNITDKNLSQLLAISDQDMKFCEGSKVFDHNTNTINIDGCPKLTFCPVMGIPIDHVVKNNFRKFTEFQRDRIDQFRDELIAETCRPDRIRQWTDDLDYLENLP